MRRVRKRLSIIDKLLGFYTNLKTFRLLADILYWLFFLDTIITYFGVKYLGFIDHHLVMATIQNGTFLPIRLLVLAFYFLLIILTYWRLKESKYPNLYLFILFLNIIFSGIALMYFATIINNLAWLWWWFNNAM